MNFWNFLQEENAHFINHEHRALVDLLHHVRYLLPVVYRTEEWFEVRKKIEVGKAIDTSLRLAILNLLDSPTCSLNIEQTLSDWKSYTEEEE